MELLKDCLKTVSGGMNVYICADIAEEGEKSKLVRVYSGAPESVPAELQEMPVVFAETIKELKIITIGILVSEEIKKNFKNAST